jgi:hypothetical protein
MYIKRRLELLQIDLTTLFITVEMKKKKLH